MKNIFSKVLVVVVVLSVVVSNMLPAYQYTYAQEAIAEDAPQSHIDEVSDTPRATEVADVVNAEVDKDAPAPFFENALAAVPSIESFDSVEVAEVDAEPQDHFLVTEVTELLPDPNIKQDESIDAVEPEAGQAPTTCTDGGTLTTEQFRQAIADGLITYSLSSLHPWSTSATFTLQNETGCGALVSLASYKMYNSLPILSTQVLFDRAYVVATSSVSLTVRVSECNTQVDAFLGMAPDTLLDSNPYPDPNWQSLPHLLAYGFFTIDEMCSTRTDNENSPPEIDLVNNPTLTVIAGEPFMDPGAVAFDMEDGNITTWIVVDSNVNPLIPGTYHITYLVTDSGGLSATVTRTVIVVPPGCDNDIELTPVEFRQAHTDGLITYSLPPVPSGDATATFTMYNYTGCTAPISLTSYKMYDPLPILSTQVLFDREGIVNATSTTVLTVDLPRCGAQIDAWFGLGPETLLDTNPYSYPNFPFVLAYTFTSGVNCAELDGDPNQPPVDVTQGETKDLFGEQTNSIGSRRDGQRKGTNGSQGGLVLGASTGPDTLAVCESLKLFLDQDWTDATATLVALLKSLALFTEEFCKQ